MRAYLINLDRARDRLERCTRMLSESGLQWERVRAIEGRKLPDWTRLYRDRCYRLMQGRTKVPAELGCYFSHLKALKAFLDSGEDTGLILEDDFEFRKGLREVLDRLHERRNDWDLVRLSTVNKGRYIRVGNLTDEYSLAVFLTREKGAGAYLVNRHAAKVMLKKFLPMWLPYDHILDIEWFYGFRSVAVYPYPVLQEGFETQIQQNIRSHYLPAWRRYWTVFPFRVVVETSRFFYRLWRAARLRFSR